MSSPPKPLRKKVKGRTFQCSGYADCSMTFTRSEHLARHVRKHTGERPFECVHCARKFSRLDNLRQHKQTVHVHEHSMKQRHDDHDDQKPLPPLPGQQTLSFQQDTADQQRQLTQHRNEDLEAPETLLRPTQFRPKHRPRPLALAQRKSVYSDAPYTVPTPRSASSGFFAISPVSHSSQNSLQQPVSTLPGVHFLSTGGNRDSLTSPYSSSFASSAHSTNNTPQSTHFDMVRTPTSIGFSQTDYKSPYERRSWLNNVLNNGSDNSPSTSISTQSPMNTRRYSSQELSVERKVRVESMLNSEEHVRLPHVDTLGIDLSSRN